MKKRLLLISLMLVLLTALMPATALAAKPPPLSAAGEINYIEATVIGDNVFPAGNSGRWRVVSREMGGELSGDINGSFLLTYKANIESTETQAGNLHGDLEVGSYVFKVNGKIQPLELVGIIEIAPGFYAPKLKLAINGHWSLSGGQGNGDFDAWVVFIPDASGHVASILASSFTMDGKW